MHICYITAEYPILNLAHGGIGSFIKTLSVELVKKKINVSILRISDINSYKIINDNGISVHLIPRSKMPLSFILNSYRINKYLKKIHLKNKVHIVETAELGLAFVKKRKGIKYIIRMHGGHHYFALAEKRKLEWRKVWQEKKSFKKADYILAVSEYVKETTRNLLNLGNQEIQVIYNPIDTVKFYRADNKKVIKHTIFFAGSIVEKKGIKQLIESIKYLVEDYPNCKLIVAGKDSFIPGTNKLYRPILLKNISENILTHIEFLGAIPNSDIPKWIEKANVCCYPSHMEAMPIAWLEVLSMGKIFIGSNLGPAKEAIKDGETGLLINPFKPKEIAEKIKWVFENEGKSKEIGDNARKEIIKRFNINSLVDENILFYKSKI